MNNLELEPIPARTKLINKTHKLIKSSLKHWVKQRANRKIAKRIAKEYLKHVVVDDLVEYNEIRIRYMPKFKLQDLKTLRMCYLDVEQNITQLKRWIFLDCGVEGKYRNQLILQLAGIEDDRLL